MSKAEAIAAIRSSRLAEESEILGGVSHDRAIQLLARAHAAILFLLAEVEGQFDNS
jgi:hypothetical protein